MLMNCKNDLQKFGLKGAVKTVKETDGETYQFNPSGFLTSATFTTKLMKPTGGIHSIETSLLNYQYDDKGRIISYTQKSKESTETEIQYDADGKRHSTEDCSYVYNDQGIVTKVTTFGVDTYNEEGLLIRTHISGMEDNIHYYYNINGQCLRRELEEEGMDEIVHKIALFAYNPQGDIIKATYITQSFAMDADMRGRQITGAYQGQEKKQLTFSYQYDKENNWISRKCSDGTSSTRTITYY